MQQSLFGFIKETAQNATKREVLSCTVVSSDPLQIKFDGDASTLLDKEVLIIPKSVTGLTAGSKVYITQAGAGGKFIIIGRG